MRIDVDISPEQIIREMNETPSVMRSVLFAMKAGVSPHAVACAADIISIPAREELSSHFESISKALAPSKR